MIGLRVGPFEITETADVPERGAWYRARRTGPHRRPPVDVLVRVATDADADVRAALQRQYELLRVLDDPRLPSAVAWYEGACALVLDVPDGVSLQILVDRASAGAPIDEGTVADLVVDLVELLERAHSRGASHGALDPSKVWLSRDNRIVVWGFGDGADPDPLWSPPERARGSSFGPTADQWSVGALAAALLLGRSPWVQAGDARNGSVEGLLTALDRRFSGVARVIRRMLEPSAPNRYANIAAARADWLAIARRAAPSRRRELAAELGAAPPAIALAIDAPPSTRPRPSAVALTVPEAQIELEVSEETPMPPRAEEAAPTAARGPVEGITPNAPPVRARPAPRVRPTADEEDSMTNEATALFETAILGRLERPTESGLGAPRALGTPKPAPKATATRAPTPLPPEAAATPAPALASLSPSFRVAMVEVEDEESTRLFGSAKAARKTTFDPDKEETSPPDAWPADPPWSLDGVTDPSGSELMSEEVLRAAIAAHEATPAPTARLPSEPHAIEPAVVRDDLQTIPPPPVEETPVILRVAPWVALAMLLGLLVLTAFNLMRG